MVQYTLRIGETAKVKKGFLGSYAVIYAGMPNDSTYSLVITFSVGNAAMAYNLFVPIHHREIPVENGHVIVSNVNSTYISFTFRRD